MTLNLYCNVISSDPRNGVCEEKRMTVEFLEVVHHEVFEGIEVGHLESTSCEVFNQSAE